MNYAPRTLCKPLNNVLIGPEMGIDERDTFILRRLGYATAESLYDATDFDRLKPTVERAIESFMNLLAARRAYWKAKTEQGGATC